VTERLYYPDSFLFEFSAKVAEVRAHDGQAAVVLDRSAFYPAGGGQPCDTGWLRLESGRVRIVDVVEAEDGSVLHLVEPAAAQGIERGARVQGTIDADRRRDHMQQHSGQHVLSAAFLELFQMPTVSFHLGEETCTIDLETPALTDEQLQRAESLANAVIRESRPVEIRFATPEEARRLGARKFNAEDHQQLRLIVIRDLDITGCGGTHVGNTGQIGAVLLRKAEKVKQGMRVEFVCGERAVRTARRDYATLAEAAGVYSTHLREVPQQVRKSQEEIKALQRTNRQLQEELAELHAARLLAAAAPHGKAKLVSSVFAERDAVFIKLVAQKIIGLALETGSVAVILLGGLGGAQPALVFAQTTGGPYDMGKLMKEVVASLGGRGGGNKEMAQGGVPAGTELDSVLARAVAAL